MDTVNPGQFTSGEHKKIVKQIVSMESKFSTQDINLLVSTQRNVLILHGSNLPYDIALANFHHCHLTRTSCPKRPPPEDLRDNAAFEKFPGEPISLVLRWYQSQSMLCYFADWIDWRYKPWLKRSFSDEYIDDMCRVLFRGSLNLYRRVPKNKKK